MRTFVEAADAEITRMAAALRLPRPAPFTPTDAVMANTDFRDFVEADAHQTARGLAAGHGPDVCELYKIGAYWGHSWLVRAALPGERNIYAVEIGYYARRLGLPEPLWAPMIARTAAAARPSDLYADGQTLTTQLAEYLQRTEPAAFEERPRG